jgi:hypothetical protein
MRLAIYPTLWVEKRDDVGYAGRMNNREWYSEVIRFCRLSESCACCPYHLLGQNQEAGEHDRRPCFASSEALLALSGWLDQPVEGTIHTDSVDGDDNQWLRDLIKMQFHDDDDEDELFLDEEFF